MPLSDGTEQDGFETVAKTSRHAEEDLRCEAAALRWLAAAEKDGGIHVARVVSTSPARLVEERVRTGAPSCKAARHAGAGIARMHAAGAPWYGCPPEGWPEGAPLGYALAASFTPLVPKNEARLSWGEFYGEQRLMPYARALRDTGTFGHAETALIERVVARLVRGDFDAGQPDLVRESGRPCARLHGDLWAGNLLWDADRTETSGATLIDPMAHGGHAETDLAMLALFGCPFFSDVIAGYEEASPLEDGWRERVGLHQLAPLLHHCVLFGGGYIAETLAVAGRYR